ncbi:MAG: glycoside hydrolase family 5 protein [Lachnospiraceae bacterium]|nr:glycoside hydrolase family 5 protein [Lachnospiraceae bacterium]
MRRFEGYQKGVNLGGWLSQCVSYDDGHFDNFITEKDIKTIASIGLDHVRVPVDYDVFMKDVADHDIVNEKGMSHIDDCIEWCRKAGLNMILDLHKAKGYMFDSNAVSDADRFFVDEMLQETFYETWEMFAQRFGKHKDILAFELLNEIVNPDYQSKWNEIASTAIKRIRAIVPDIYIIVGGVNYNNVFAVSGISVPFDEKTVLNFHCYEPLCFTHQKAYWVPGMTEDFDMNYPEPLDVMRRKSEEFSKDHMGAVFDERLEKDGPFFDKLFRDAVEYAREKDLPLYCGEYGVIDRAPLPDTLRWMKDIHESFEKFGIGRALWNYKDKDFGLVDRHYAPILRQMTELL